MSRISTFCAFAISTSTFFATITPAASNGLENTVGNWRSQHEILGVSASCATDDGVHTVTSGFATDARQTQLTSSHQFQIGSIAKTFTAATILRLVEENEVSLQDPLSNWFPHYPNADAITLLQLLNMTAGTFDYFRANPDNPVIPLIMQNIHRTWTAGEMIEIAANQTPHAESGDVFWYSNTNYLLLGRIAEMVTGDELANVYQELLFEAANLKDTSLAGSQNSADMIAPGYLRDSSFLFGQDAPFSSQPNDLAGMASLAWAAGGMTATSGDVARWGIALFTNQIISQSQIEDMEVPTKLSLNANSPYGLGVEIFETKLGKAFGHPGSIPGYAAVLMYFPTLELSVSVLSNDEAGEPHLKALAVEIASQGCES